MLKFEKALLEELPCALMYEKSYMHRATVTRVAVAATGFVLTASADGHVKFWRKQPVGIEFVKHFVAHLGAVVALKTTRDGAYAASLGSDGFVKIYDVLNFGTAPPASSCGADWSPALIRYDHNLGAGVPRI